MRTKRHMVCTLVSVRIHMYEIINELGTLDMNVYVVGTLF